MAARIFAQAFNNPSTSGIVADPFNSDRKIVPASRRPDGTLRKEIRIRPGYTPAEDQAKFRSTRQVESEARALPKGSVVGYIRPEVQESTAALNAAAKKNAKRKEKRHQASMARDEPFVADTWDSEPDEETKSTPSEPVKKDALVAKPKEVAKEPVKEQPKLNKEEEHLQLQKKAKALQKKLRQAEQLKEKADAGESLLPEQQEKADAIDDLSAELKSLEEMMAKVDL